VISTSQLNTGQSPLQHFVKQNDFEYLHSTNFVSLCEINVEFFVVFPPKINWVDSKSNCPASYKREPSIKRLAEEKDE